MTTYIDRLHRHLTKLAEGFDLDDLKDQEAYDRWKQLPTRDSHIKRISREYQDGADFNRKAAKYLGLGALATGAYALGSPGPSPISGALTVGLGTGAGLGLLGAWADEAAKKRYDRGSREYRMNVNREDYMQHHGSPYAGRKAQIQAERDRQARIESAALIASALADRDRRGRY